MLLLPQGSFPAYGIATPWKGARNKVSSVPPALVRSQSRPWLAEIRKPPAPGWRRLSPTRARGRGWVLLHQEAFSQTKSSSAGTGCRTVCQPRNRRLGRLSLRCVPQFPAHKRKAASEPRVRSGTGAKTRKQESQNPYLRQSLPFLPANGSRTEHCRSKKPNSGLSPGSSPRFWAPRPPAVPCWRPSSLDRPGITEPLCQAARFETRARPRTLLGGKEERFGGN